MTVLVPGGTFTAPLSRISALAWSGSGPLFECGYIRYNSAVNYYTTRYWIRTHVPLSQSSDLPLASDIDTKDFAFTVEGIRRTRSGLASNYSGAGYSLYGGGAWSDLKYGFLSDATSVRSWTRSGQNQMIGLGGDHDGDPDPPFFTAGTHPSTYPVYITTYDWAVVDIEVVLWRASPPPSLGWDYTVLATAWEADLVTDRLYMTRRSTIDSFFRAFAFFDQGYTWGYCDVTT